MRDHTKLRAFELADEVAVLIYRTTRGFPTLFRCLGCGLLALVAFGAAGPQDSGLLRRGG